MVAPVHEVRLATRDDGPRLRRFIDEHWKQGHILARDEAFFDYEHGAGQRVNFALGVNRATGEIDAVLGFLKYTEAYDRADIFLVIWKVRQRAGSPLLGLRLLSFLQRSCGFSSVSSCGINEATVGIYQRLGFHTGTLRHHYSLNPDRRVFSVAHVASRREVARPEGSSSDLREITSFGEFAERAAPIVFKGPPVKDLWYIERRYFSHPINRYRMFAIEDGREITGLLVTRDATAEGSKALRIIDLLGAEAACARAGAGLRALVVEGDYEYVDLYETGLSDHTVHRLGLVTRSADDPNIIPDYFSPFAQLNVDLRFATTIPGIRMFKGDGDQDRPS